MSKILLVNGSPNEYGCCGTALEEIANEFAKNEVETETLWLGKKPMQDCIACFQCKVKGKCVFDDDPVNDIAARADEFAGFIFASPVYYGGPNGRLTSFMDRLIFSAGDNKWAGKLAASVVSCRRAGATEAFERLNQYYLMTNMICVGSQYWNNIHGGTAEDAKKDAEGLQTMRTLAKNMSWLLKSIEAGRANGVTFPEYEEHIYTNFIQ